MNDHFTFRRERATSDVARIAISLMRNDESWRVDSCQRSSREDQPSQTRDCSGE